jgi:DNA-binding NtrC family response regulator
MSSADHADIVRDPGAAVEHRHSVLLVDDETVVLEMLSHALERGGLRVRIAADAQEALAQVRHEDFDAVLSDMRMPGVSGIELLGPLRELSPETPVILMTGYGSIDSAVAGIRAGAFDYITKPSRLNDLPKVVLATLERAFEWRALQDENRRLRRAVDQTRSLGDLVGASPAMREIFGLIRKVAETRSTVLITGESGTGKEVVARAIHFCGPRSSRPFVPVNCTAIPEGLLESELFGHAKGAFTGAHASHKGLFEAARGGTLFLDEIGDMTSSMQSKLLRVLQDQEVRPVGSTATLEVDVRIIAATNQDLAGAIEADRFREDLYYRLNVIPIHIPPLRERPDDIPVLAEFCLQRCGASDRRLSPDALDRLCRQVWKGNVRELENVIERSVALADRPVIRATDLLLPDEEDPLENSSAEEILRNVARERKTLREVEDLYIAEVIKLMGGNKVQSARILGVSRGRLYHPRKHAERRPAPLPLGPRPARTDCSKVRGARTASLNRSSPADLDP